MAGESVLVIDKHLKNKQHSFVLLANIAKCVTSMTKTTHHCVPRSMDGINGSNLNGYDASSDVPNMKNCNITRIEEKEHIAYHRVMERKMPDFHLRKLLLLGIDSKDMKCLPPGAAKDLLDVLLTDDWRSLYVPEAFRSVQEESGAGLGSGQCDIKGMLAQTALHLQSDIDEERGAARAALQYVVTSKFIPIDAERYVIDVRLFLSRFVEEVIDIRDCMKLILSDRYYSDDELKWVKPMRNEIREELLRVLESADPVSIHDDGVRSRYMDVFIDYQDRLEDCSKMWEPSISTYREEIRRLVNSTFHHGRMNSRGEE